MRLSNEWKDYECLDAGNGEKLERWGDVILRRPDPQAIWTVDTYDQSWKNVDGHYFRSRKGGGEWKFYKKLPDHWTISYKELTFKVSPTNFKHTGLFPEQATNWDYMMDKISKKIKENKQVKVLNLFAYTGGATVACLKAGASVCHVDSSQGMVNWAKENVISSNLKDKSVRYIVDDVVKFVKREIRRNNKYDCIIMDPPSYGRGKNKEVWNIEKDLENLVNLCGKLLSDDPLFMMINTYTGGLSGTIISNLVTKSIEDRNIKKISFDEIGLKQKNTNIFLPAGITTICEF